MPNRILKESICTSETLAQLEPASEVFWYRLLVQCDDFGRMDARPAILRARCYPLALERVSEADIDAWLQDLAGAGLVIVYTVDDKPYLQVATWDRHQQKRAKYSKYPAMLDDDGTCKQLISDDSNSKHMSPRSEKRETRNEHESEHIAAAVAVWESLGLTVSGFMLGQVSSAVDEWAALGHPEYVAQAVEVAGKANKRSWSYVEGILRRCRDEGTAPTYTNGASKVVPFNQPPRRSMTDEQLAYADKRQVVYEYCLENNIIMPDKIEAEYAKAGVPTQ